MKRKRFSEEQIIGILKEHEVGRTAAVLARQHRFSENTLYNWKAKGFPSSRRIVSGVRSHAFVFI